MSRKTLVERQIQQQQAGGRGGGNRNIEDMSSLFDKELARHQQTNYETPKSAAQDDEKASAIDKIKDLARRQDEKGLSGGERQLLLRAKRLLASELQYARKTDEEEALAWIDDVLSPEARAA